MRKESPKVMQIFKSSLVAILVFTLSLGFVPAVYAESDIPWYRIDLKLGEKLKEINPVVAIPRTVVDAMSYAATSGTASILYGSSPDDIGTCGTAIIADIADDLGIREDLIDDFGTVKEKGVGGETIEREVFSEEIFDEATEASETIDCDFETLGVGSKVSGSVLGVTKLARSDILESSPPVSLAYYLKHTAKKIPYVNQTAFAQDADVSYNAIVFDLTLEIWEVSRNIAYSIMSIIMLIIGMMIIARKQINPQTIVTVQTALPRIVISLILITFSYPIAGILVSSMLFLVGLVVRLFLTTVWEDLVTVMRSRLNDIIMGHTAFLLGYFSQAVFSIMAALLMMGMFVITMLLVFVKIIMVYFKIMMDTVVAPIQFALAAIPGQEKLIMDWFKKMLARILSIPAIFFFMFFSVYILAKPFTDAELLRGIIYDQGAVVRTYSMIKSVVSRVFGLIFIPVLAIMTMWSAHKADKMVENFILGPPHKRK